MPLLIDLGPLAVMGIAILALLLLLGVVMLLRWLASLFGGAWFPLTTLASWIRSAEAAVYNATVDFLKASWAVTGWLFRLLWAPLAYLLDNTNTAVKAAHGAVTRVVTVHLPQAVAGAENWATQVASTALTEAVQYTGAVESALSTVIGDVYNVVTTEIHVAYTALANADRALASDLVTDVDNVTSWASHAINTEAAAAAAATDALGAWTAHTIATEVAAIDGTINEVINWTAGAVTAAETYAAAAATEAEHGAINAMNEATAGAVAPLWPLIVTPTNDVIDSLSTEYPEVAGNLRTLPIEAPATIAASMAAVMAATIPMTAYMQDCGIPMCEGLSTLLRDAGGLAALLGDGIMLAALAAIVEDPAGAATATVEVAQVIIDPVVSLVQEVFSL